jgi:Spy/CpxP family protein refolding chaperone
MSDSRTRIWFSLFVLAVFCVGLATGLLIGRRMGEPPPPRRGPGFANGPMGPPPGPGGLPPGRLLDRLERDLDLTAEQKATLEPILNARRKRLEDVHESVVARAEQEQRELQAEIRKVLTPEQQKRFDRWLQDAPRGRRGPPRPGMGMGR